MTISDTGIGMTREEMITNLGPTIARSDSKAFCIRSCTKEKYGRSTSTLDAALSIIGQFGVGFL
jgi:HSP90 family molecular chaperone